MDDGLKRKLAHLLLMQQIDDPISWHDVESDEPTDGSRSNAQLTEQEEHDEVAARTAETFRRARGGGYVDYDTEMPKWDEESEDEVGNHESQPAC